MAFWLSGAGFMVVIWRGSSLHGEMLVREMRVSEASKPSMDMHNDAAPHVRAAHKKHKSAIMGAIAAFKHNITAELQVSSIQGIAP